MGAWGEGGKGEGGGSRKEEETLNQVPDVEDPGGRFQSTLTDISK